MNSVLSGERSKIIHLSHHVGNFNDPEAQSAVGSNPTDARVSGTSGGVIDAAAVDRFDFGGGRVLGAGTDWSGQIDQEAGTPAVAGIALDHITLDKTSSGTYYIVHAYVRVTLSQSIPDDLKLYFAVVQDGVTLPPSDACSPEPTTQNDVVRMVSAPSSGNAPIAVFTGGGSSGASVIVDGSFNVHNPSSDPTYIFSKMRLVGFLEESSSSSDFHVVNAAVLRQDLDTLSSPPASLSLVSTGLDDSSFYAGSQISVQFNSTFLPGGVHPYYSLDNGANWHLFATADNVNTGSIPWTIPDTETTQGKIKLIAVDNASLTSTETGTFSIKFKPYVHFTHPVGTIDTAAAKSVYQLRWTPFRVPSVSLQYQIAAIVNPKWISLAKNITDTFFNWTTPDTTAYTLVQILPNGGEADAVLDTVVVQKSLFGAVDPTSTPTFAIQDVYPNPVTGNDVMVRYSVAKPCDLQFEIIDILGHQVFLDRSSVVQPGDYHLKTSSLPNGSYVVRISDGEHTASKRMEITR